MKSETQDTRSKGSREKPGALLNEGRWRVESDSLGEVKVQADRLWGAQTQRSLEHFCIGQDLIPREMITAYATLKKAAAAGSDDSVHSAAVRNIPHADDIALQDRQ
ncbi:MAG: hypothetical protein WB999_09600 [Candidatus Binataceae bacterium]